MISHIMTLANGIIGVSVLAMPFCFKQCGIVLATLMLLLSSLVSRLACHFLIKSAVMSRRRNFEFLAFHTFGPMGKFLVELCIIGFLLGTCIAFFVVVGDLGPQIVGDMINKSPEDIRTSFLITTGIFIVLPLGLLRNIDSLASVSTASIAFYICLVLKVVAESTRHIFAGDWFDKVNFWRPGGILQCLPIFALALFCQTQLFEIYEAMPNATLEKMNQVVQGALNICTFVYFCMGCFGYIAFCTLPFTGNILMSFEPNFTSEIIKIGFVLSVAFSFPLVIFPCRASLNSLLFRRGYAFEATTSYISEARFRCLTTFIVTVALTVGVLIPNIELVLGIIGSTIGIIICLIFPAAFFISISTKNTNERLLAQIMVFIGTTIMVLGTYANLYAMEQSSNLRITTTTMKLPSQMNNLPNILVNNEMLMKPEAPKPPDSLLNVKVLDDSNRPKEKLPVKPPDSENVRQEPPVPVERLPEVEKAKNKQEAVVLDPVTMSPKIQEIVYKINNMDNKLIDDANKVYDSLKKIKEKVKNDLPAKSEVEVPVKEKEKVDSVQKNDVIAVDAIKKEESELAADKEISNVEVAQSPEKVDTLEKHMKLEKTLEDHMKVQKEMMKEQKELLKDIKQREQEIQQAKIENVEQERKDNPENENVEKNKPNDIELPKYIEEKLKGNNPEVQNNLPLQEEVKPLISNIQESQSEVKDFQNKVHIQNNEVPGDLNKNTVESKPINVENLKNINNLPLDINVSKLTANLLMQGSKDPIIKVLTKQSIKISNDNEVQMKILEKDDKNDANKENKQINIKRDEKDEQPIPIVLVMNNQTKRTLGSEQVEKHINQSNVDAAAVRRDILEEHQREKRMAEEEKYVFNTTLNETEEIKKESINENKVDYKQEICNKKEAQLEGTISKEKIPLDKSSGDKHPESLIKASAYLSEQDIMKKVSINPDLTIGSNFVKVKKRDLKTVKFERENEK